jgi:uncharacterized protein YabN with tetrapyrrole methylase and pyrophosphatase domain
MNQFSRQADIYLVGLGMFDLLHLTVETSEILKAACIVYHLSGKHEQLTGINPRTHNLDGLRWRPGGATGIYDDIAAFVVDAATRNRPVVFAVDGNPMLFSDVSWKIAAAGQRAGLLVEALPGVSCLDVLPLQLGFEPGDLGLQVFEATQLVIYGLQMNPYLSTLILQVGYFFHDVTLPPVRRQPHDFAPLVEHILRFFPEDHPAIFIEAADSIGRDTIVFSVEIGSIDAHRDDIRPGMTLYIPRSEIPPVRPEFRKRLNSHGTI